jgi:hypothetical protein
LDWTFSVFADVPLIQIFNPTAREFNTIVAKQLFISFLFSTGFYAANSTMIGLIPSMIAANAFVFSALKP